MTGTVLLLAGEASGDQHGASLAAVLQQRRPGLRFVGTGGPRMAAAGVELLAGLDDLAVMGFLEVVPRLAFFRRLMREVESVMEARAVALVVPIDFPGFNLRVARLAHARGRRVLYYIPPKTWASRPGRVRTLARTTDRVATILPFEAHDLIDAGVRAAYVGHPLLDSGEVVEDERTFRERWGIEMGGPLLAVLPGSREQEIERHLPLFAQAAELVRLQRPDVIPVVSRAESVSRESFGSLPYPVVEDARGLLRHAHAALVKSGTATLEAAIEGTPLVVAYRTSLPNWVIAKAFLRTRHVALPNLIAGRTVVPEILQSAATSETLAAELLPLMERDSTARRAQLDGLAGVREALGSPGATERVADLAIELMDSAHG